MTRIIIASSTWDDGDQIISVRPEYEKPWCDVPVGGVLSKQDAAIVLQWLEGAMPVLQQLILQIEQDPRAQENK